MAQWLGASFLQLPWSQGYWFISQFSLVVASLDKMLQEDCLRLVESGKQQIKEVRKFNRKTWKQGQLLSESGFILCIAPPPLSRDRRIKITKSVNHIKSRKTLGKFSSVSHFFLLHVAFQVCEDSMFSISGIDKLGCKLKLVLAELDLFCRTRTWTRKNWLSFKLILN